MTHRQLQQLHFAVYKRLIDLGLITPKSNYDNIFLSLNRKIELLARAEEADAKGKR